MDIREFAEEMRKQLLERISDVTDIRIEKRLKNNSVEPTALAFVKESNNICPLLYVDGYYQQYMSGVSLEANAKQMIAAYQNAKEHPHIDVSFMYDWDKVKPMVAFKLINTERNQELLQSIPHQEFLDLSMVFHIVINDIGGTILIHNNHCDMWGINLEELFRVAKENTPTINPANCMSIKDVIMNFMEEDEDEIPDEVEMFVLSNQRKSFGAATMLYPNNLKAIADKLESNLFILPSSTHEVLAVPTKKNDATYLRSMVNEVNNHSLGTEDILSYNVYLYDWAKDEIIIAP